jgi:hypothetical protein
LERYTALEEEPGGAALADAPPVEWIPVRNLPPLPGEAAGPDRGLNRGPKGVPAQDDSDEEMLGGGPSRLCKW